MARSRPARAVRATHELQERMSRGRGAWAGRARGRPVHAPASAGRRRVGGHLARGGRGDDPVLGSLRARAPRVARSLSRPAAHARRTSLTPLPTLPLPLPLPLPLSPAPGKRPWWSRVRGSRKRPAAVARGGHRCGREWPPRSGPTSGRTREGEAAHAHRTCERREAGGLKPVGDGGLGQLLRLRGGGYLRARERRAEVSAVATDGGCHCQVAERACADVFEVSGRVTDAGEKARHTGSRGWSRAPSCSSACCRRGLRAFRRHLVKLLVAPFMDLRRQVHGRTSGRAMGLNREPAGLKRESNRPAR